MKFVINDIRLSLDDGIEALKMASARKLGISSGDLTDFRIVKEAVDARRKPNISIVYSVMLETGNKVKLPQDGSIKPLEEAPEPPLLRGDIKLNDRPVIIGSGPAGLFAGLVLSEYGYKPIILERGDSVERRSEIVKRYWETGVLDPETNVQFGEGGAGTFSDGKLTTRINDTRCSRVLEEFVRAGAPEEILYKAKPHIGTDNLKFAVVNMRKRIEENGGEFRFNTRVTSVVIKDGRVTGISTSRGEDIPAEVVVLAIGHSARDTFTSLLEGGVTFMQKAFSIGVRIEHPQELINTAQYGRAAVHARLSNADYQLFCKISGRTAYSFCMCPGGVVVASASETGTVVTNGMSEFKRDKENANSALVVSVGPGDFGGSHPLAGVEFQRIWERKAYEMGGGGNCAPVQRLEDFISGRATVGFCNVKPSYTGNVRCSDLNGCLPDFVTNPMKEAAGRFDKKLKGYGLKDAILTGVETRTSSPVRIPRNEALETVGAGGLYPAGEGAGYAGGIVSAAVDGIRIAEQIVKTFRPM